MRLVSFSELMQMPQGTICQEYQPHNLGEPWVFGGPIGDNDFARAYFLPQAGCASYWSDPAILSKWGVSVEDLTVNYPSNFGRDGGCCTKDSVFLVWDYEDRKALAAWLLDVPLCAAQQNDDPHAMIKAPI